MEKTFSEAFNEHLDRTGARVTDIASKSGVKKDSLYALKRGTTRNMGVDDAIRVAAAFGETVEQFMGLAPVLVRDQLSEQIGRLTEQEQAVLEATLAALLSQRKQAAPATQSDTKTIITPADQLDR